jgi:hypothetical protein
MIPGISGFWYCWQLVVSGERQRARGASARAASLASAMSRPCQHPIRRTAGKESRMSPTNRRLIHERITRRTYVEHDDDQALIIDDPDEDEPDDDDADENA